MKLKALDSFYTDETKMIDARKEFEVDSEDFGQQLIKRGLAVEFHGDAKKKPDPSNKSAGRAPSNKSAGE